MKSYSFPTLAITAVLFLSIEIFAFSSVPAVLADPQDPKLTAEYHSQYALKLLRDGNVSQALERFLRAVLFDPNNQNAVQNLRSLASGTAQGITSLEAVRIARFLEQVEYLQFLQKRNESLAAENSRLIDFIKRLELKDTLKKRELNAFESSANSRVSRLLTLKDFRLFNDEGTLDVPGLLSQLDRQRSVLIAEIDFWGGQNQGLRALRRDLLAGQTLNVGAKGSAAAVSDLQTRLTEKEKLVEAQARNLDYFRNEIALVRDNFKVLQNKFSETDQKIAELTKKLAEMSIELFEKNKQINSQAEKITVLKNELLESTEKLSLSQRILSEKDSKILALETRLAQGPGVSLAPGAATGAPQGDIAQFQNEMKAFEKTFKQEMLHSRERIIELETEFAQLNNQYEILTRETSQKDTAIATLATHVKEKELAVSQYRNAFLSSNEQVSQLNGIVELYRTKLIEARQNLRTKEDELNKLLQERTLQNPVIDQFRSGILESQMQNLSSILAQQ